MSVDRASLLITLQNASEHQPTTLDNDFYGLRLTIAEVREILLTIDRLANRFYRNVYSISDDGCSPVTPLPMEDWGVYQLACAIIGETPDPDLAPKEVTE